VGYDAALFAPAERALDLCRHITVVVLENSLVDCQIEFENTSPLGLLPVSFSLQNYLNYSFYVFD